MIPRTTSAPDSPFASAKIAELSNTTELLTRSFRPARRDQLIDKGFPWLLLTAHQRLSSVDSSLHGLWCTRLRASTRRAERRLHDEAVDRAMLAFRRFGDCYMFRSGDADPKRLAHHRSSHVIILTT